MNDQPTTAVLLFACTFGSLVTCLAFSIVIRAAEIIYHSRRVAADREQAIIRNRLRGCGCVENSPPSPPPPVQHSHNQHRYRLTASTTHRGHVYVIRYTPEFYDDAVVQLIKWVDDDSVDFDTNAARRLGFSMMQALVAYTESRGQDESEGD